MGMQAHFNYADLDEQCKSSGVYTCTRQRVAGFDSAVVRNYLQGNTLCMFNLIGSDSCWIDIGSMTPQQMADLQFLIRLRIPFSCS